MSHDEFLLGYQSGRLGCSVSAMLILRLFLTGRIRRKRVVFTLIGWSFGLLFGITLSVCGFLYLPVLWTLVATIIFLTVAVFGFNQTIGGLIVSTALADEQFYRFALAERALWISVDDEGNLPKLQRVVPLRDPRRAQR
jgi:hypothetical protein